MAPGYADLHRPNVVAWRRFQAELVIEFIGWQAGIVREITGGRGFVTTCISYKQPGIEDAELSRALDVASGNAYYEMQDSLAHPNALPRSSGPMGWVVRGLWAVTQLADLMYSSKQAPFLVTETNTGSIGFSAMKRVALRRPKAPAGLAAYRARGAAHRVLALEHPAVRHRDVLGAACFRAPRADDRPVTG